MQSPDTLVPPDARHDTGDHADPQLIFGMNSIWLIHHTKRNRYVYAHWTEEMYPKSGCHLARFLLMK